MRALHGSTGMVLTWDDHGSSTTGTPRRSRPRGSTPRGRRSSTGPRAAIRPRRRGLWRHRLGQDARPVRPRRALGAQAVDAPARTRSSSPAQMAWLKQGSRRRRPSSSSAHVGAITTSRRRPPARRTSGRLPRAARRDPRFRRDETIPACGGCPATSTSAASAPWATAARGCARCSWARAARRPRDVTLAAPQFERVVGEKNYTVFRADPVKKAHVTFVPRTARRSSRRPTRPEQASRRRRARRVRPASRVGGAEVGIVRRERGLGVERRPSTKRPSRHCERLDACRAGRRRPHRRTVDLQERGRAGHRGRARSADAALASAGPAAGSCRGRRQRHRIVGGEQGVERGQRAPEAVLSARAARARRGAARER